MLHDVWLSFLAALKRFLGSMRAQMVNNFDFRIASQQRGSNTNYATHTQYIMRHVHHATCTVWLGHPCSSQHWQVHHLWVTCFCPAAASCRQAHPGGWLWSRLGRNLCLPQQPSQGFADGRRPANPGQLLEQPVHEWAHQQHTPGQLEGGARLCDGAEIQRQQQAGATPGMTQAG